MSCVMDSWALLAFLEGKDSAAKKAAKAMSEAVGKDDVVLVHEVNLAEFYAALDNAGGADDVLGQATAWLDLLPLKIVGCDSAAFSRLAAWYKVTYELPIGAAFALALSDHNRVKLVTGDPAFRALKDFSKLVWIGDSALLAENSGI